MNPHQVTKDFEKALCEYTGAPYAVTTSSCTMALLLAVAWHLRHPKPGAIQWVEHLPNGRPLVEIPKRTYISVPMSIIHAGGRPTFRDEEWLGLYQLKPLPVWDSARYFSSNMYKHNHVLELPAREGSGVDKIKVLTPLRGSMVCVSFHWSKTLGIQQGGAILHDNPEADDWLRRARFDGRAEGIPPKYDTFKQIGWHCYMSPEVAAEGLMRLSFLPKHNAPLPNDEYPDISEMSIFK